MQLRLLDILADPNTKDWPLKLHVFKETIKEREINAPPYPETGLYCRFYCAKNNYFFIKNPGDEKEEWKDKNEWNEEITIQQCKECIKKEIIEGVLISERKNGTKQWFPIVDEIPVMFPDELRDKGIDTKFIEKYKQELKQLGLKI